MLVFTSPLRAFIITNAGKSGGQMAKNLKERMKELGSTSPAKGEKGEKTPSISPQTLTEGEKRERAPAPPPLPPRPAMMVQAEAKRDEQQEAAPRATVIPSVVKRQHRRQLSFGKREMLKRKKEMQSDISVSDLAKKFVGATLVPESKVVYQERLQKQREREAAAAQEIEESAKRWSLPSNLEPLESDGTERTEGEIVFQRRQAQKRRQSLAQESEARTCMRSWIAKDKSELWAGMGKVEAFNDLALGKAPVPATPPPAVAVAIAKATETPMSGSDVAK
ncbi:unnamed protein product [Chrysoparadoxa australica]